MICAHSWQTSHNRGAVNPDIIVIGITHDSLLGTASGEEKINVTIIDEVRIETEPDQPAFAVGENRLRCEWCCQHRSILHDPHFGGLCSPEPSFADNKETAGAVRGPIDPRHT